MVKVRVEGHYAKRGRKRYYVSGHLRKTVTSKMQGRSGAKFKALESTVYQFYRAKGYSPSRAMRAAKGTAGKQFWHKFGKRRGKRILKRER